MKNPLRSEAEAFQFLLGAAVYFGLIAIAGVINRWAGLAVFIVLSAVVVAWWMRARRLEPPRQETPARRGDPDERRILVIANETVGGEALRERIEEHSRGHRTSLLVVTPALNSPVRTFTSDVDKAREEAQQRLDASLARLRQGGSEGHRRRGSASRCRSRMWSSTSRPSDKKSAEAPTRRRRPRRLRRLCRRGRLTHRL